MHDEIYSRELDPLTADQAWAIGLFEGEGCLTISSGWPRLKLTMVDEDTVRRFHRIVGYGQVREDSSPLARGWQAQWEWYAASKDHVRSFLEEFFCYLGARRQSRAIDLIVAAT